MNVFDVHTHSSKKWPHILNIRDFKQNLSSKTKDQYFSVGIHPWDANKYNVEDLVRFVSDNSNKIISIGECGLDRKKGPSIDLQLEVFTKQVVLAAELNLPVILHTVRSTSDVLPVIKKYPKLSYVFHGYSGNKIQTNQLLKFKTYFSFGELLLTGSHKINDTLKNVPIDRVLFESDESNRNISEIYQAYCNICNVKYDVLTKSVTQNVEFVFGIKL